MGSRHVCGCFIVYKFNVVADYEHILYSELVIVMKVVLLMFLLVLCKI